MPPEVKPLEFDSKPHWRCGNCYNVLSVDKVVDKKPYICKWCLCGIDWDGTDKEERK